MYRAYAGYQRLWSHLFICIQFILQVSPVAGDGPEAHRSPLTLLQTRAAHSHENARVSLPTGFFEDALQDDVLADAASLQHVHAPHDVGFDAVKLPDDMEEALEVRERRRNKLSVLQTPQRTNDQSASRGGPRGFFSDEDPVQQVRGHMPVHAVEVDSLLTKDIREETPLLSDLEAVSIDEQALPPAAERPIVIMQRKAPQHVDLREGRGDFDDSSAFVEELAEQGAEDTGLGEEETTPEGIDLLEEPQQTSIEIPEDVPATPAIVHKKVHKPVSLLASSAKTQASSEKGHSMLGEPVTPEGQLAEEGEEIIAAEDPNSLQFGEVPEAQLQAEKALYEKEEEVEANTTASRVALAHLRNTIYHSANMSRQRLEEEGKLQTSLHRAELLTDANRYKTQIAQADRVREQTLAEYERDLKLAAAALQKEYGLSQTSEKAISAAQPGLADQQAVEQPLGYSQQFPSTAYTMQAPASLMSTAPHRNTSMLLDRQHKMRGHAVSQPSQAVGSTPDHQACTPQCSWQCDDPHCDEVCQPVCQPPQCETRCSGTDLSQCFMECDDPHCAITCPQSECPTGGCASCQTTCSEPMCKLRCNSAQPCRNVCEEPVCEWKCQAPSQCPKPTCRLMCETPGQCHGSTFTSMPPLEPGEASVRSFAAGMLQQGPGVPTSLRGNPTSSQPPAPSALSVPVSYRQLSSQTPLAAPPVEQRTVQLPVRSIQHVRPPSH
mmetsp:Transcript_42951/g.98620  ORF Transcript_42951/g.98620 Transcript_42951/m.98620 type:complete len:721 (+) Transcript_42951:70-2232(+)